MSDSVDGSAWSDAENDIIVADYFAMLVQEMAGKAAVKAHHNRGLVELTGRSRGSIERKHMNISAVLERLGLPRIRGYGPNVNFQNSLIAAIERYLSFSPWMEVKPESLREAVFNSSASLWIGRPPVVAIGTPEISKPSENYGSKVSSSRTRVQC